MSSQPGSRMTSYGEAIQGLKKELETHVADLQSATQWAEFVRLYRALCTIEEIAGTPKTSLEELLGITPVPANLPDTNPQSVEKKSALELGDQVETEPVTEIEKGA
jgi:hypothetical protein